MNTVDVCEHADDPILIRSWQQGNENSYTAFFKKYYHLSLQYVYRITRDKCLSEEIVMDVMVNIWQKKHLINDEKPISSLVFSSVRNKTIDYRRKKKLRFEHLTHQMSAASPSSDHDAIHYIREKELGELYAKGLQRLSPRRRQVFQMSREGDMS